MTKRCYYTLASKPGYNSGGRRGGSKRLDWGQGMGCGEGRQAETGGARKLDRSSLYYCRPVTLFGQMLTNCRNSSMFRLSDSAGTVHTSAKARLTSVAISVPPSGIRLYPLTTFRIFQQCESGKQSMYSGGDLDRHQNLIICSLANLSRKFHVNPLGSFCAKLLTDRQNKQTNNDDYI